MMKAQQPDHRFTNVIGLGRLQRVFTRGAWHWGAAIFILAFFAASVILHLTWSIFQTRCGRIELVFTLAVLALLAWGFWRQRGDAVALFDGGIAYVSPTGVKQLAWAEMQDLREGITASTSGDIDVVSVYFTIETRSGAKIDLPPLGRQNDLWQAAQQAVTDLRLAGNLDALRAGATLDFGPIRLSSAGLEFTALGKSQFRAWSDIARLEQKRTSSPLDNIEVWTHSADSAPRRWITVGRSQMPNAHLFLALCRNFVEVRT